MSTHLGLSDLEQKFSADEREAYMNTSSEETEITNEKINKKRRKP